MAFVATAAGAVGLDIISTAAAPFYQPFFGALLTREQQRMSVKMPLGLPSAVDIITALYAGYLEGDQNVRIRSVKTLAEWGLRAQGILAGKGVVLDAESEIEARGRLWAGWSRLQSPVPDLVSAWRALSAGLIDQKYFNEVVQRQRINWNDWHHLVPLFESHLTPYEIRDAWLRGLLNKNGAARILAYQGLLDTTEVEAFFAAAKPLPPISDAIHFAVRDTFSPTKIGRAQMLAELREQVGLQDLGEALGLTGATYGKTRLKSHTEDFLTHYWLAHYVNVSPTQAFEMLHRLRPSRITRFRFAGLNPQPIEIGRVRQLLKEDDYSPAWRDELAAISYRPLGRIDVRRIYSAGGFGEVKGEAGFRFDPVAGLVPNAPAETELSESYQDLGYNPTDATRMAWWTAKEFSAERPQTIRRRAIKSALKSYQLGAVSRNAAIKQLHALGLYGSAADQVISTADLDDANSWLLAFLRSLRSRLLHGVLSPDQVRFEMRRANIVEEKIAQYLDRWLMEFTPRRRELTVAKIIEATNIGILTETESVGRLRNLGYADDDARILLTIAKKKMEVGSAKSTRKKVAAEDEAGEGSEMD